MVGAKPYRQLQHRDVDRARMAYVSGIHFIQDRAFRSPPRLVDGVLGGAGPRPPQNFLPVSGEPEGRVRRRMTEVASGSSQSHQPIVFETGGPVGAAGGSTVSDLAADSADGCLIRVCFETSRRSGPCREPRSALASAGRTLFG
jgi:hypothetical protein